MKGRSWDAWVTEYGQSHRHPINRLCHSVGIPLVALSLIAMLASLMLPFLWWPSLTAFGFGWLFQFIGHAFEGKPPEFFRDWRFLLVGLRWWLAKVRGKV